MVTGNPAVAALVEQHVAEALAHAKFQQHQFHGGQGVLHRVVARSRLLDRPLQEQLRNVMWSSRIGLIRYFLKHRV